MYAYIAGILELMDIESMFGPNWDSQMRRLCAVVGFDSEYCDFFKNFPVGPIAGGDIYGYSEIGV